MSQSKEMLRAICNIGRAQDLINGQKTYHPIYGDLYANVKTDIGIIRAILHNYVRQIAVGMSCPLPSGLHGKLIPLIKDLDKLIGEL